MEEIKVWAMDGSETTLLQPSKAVPEKLFEETLVKNPQILMPGLKLVGRQTRTEGGPLDLLGVDEDGRLVVFELKREMLSREAVAQVIDYASYLDSLNDGGLAELISEKSGNLGIDKIDDFEDWYEQHGAGEGLEALRPIRMVLVGLGVDDKTERMVRFLAKNMEISLLILYGLDHDGKTLLARQMRVEGGGTVVSSTIKVVSSTIKKVDREDIGRQLHDRAKRYGVSELYEQALAMFRQNFAGCRERPIRVGLNFRLRIQYAPGKLGWRWCARVDPIEGRCISVVFHSRSIELCEEKFREAIKDIQFGTYPRGRGDPFEPGTEIWFQLTPENWENHKHTIDGLARGVYDALQKRNQGTPVVSDDDDDEDD